MADLSDDTEALKHNFLFRGFFNRRGFFDLDGMTAPEYKSPSFGKGFKKHRIWLESVDLFSRDGNENEVLNPAGKARLDEALNVVSHLFQSDEPFDLPGTYFPIHEGLMSPRPSRPRHIPPIRTRPSSASRASARASSRRFPQQSPRRVASRRRSGAPSSSRAATSPSAATAGSSGRPTTSS